MKWLKAFLHVLFILVISEILFWVIPIDTTSFYTPHAKYLFTHGSTTWTHKTIYDIATNQWMRFNQFGYRNPEIKDKKNYRILVYGDSILAAFHLNESETYPRKLEGLLNQSKTKKFEVINAGICGYGPDQIYLRMKDEIPKFKPDFVIINLFSFNDYGDLIRNKLVRITQDGRTEWQTVRPTRRVALSYLAEKIKWLRLLLTIQYRHLAGRSATFDQQLNQCLLEDQMYRINPDFQERSDHYDFDLATNPELPSSQLKTQLMRKIIEEISSYLREEHIPSLIVILPAINDLMVAIDPRKSPFNQKYPLYSSSRLTDIAQKISADSALPFINMYPVLLKALPQNIAASDGIHYNANGCAIIADTVSNYIQTQIEHLHRSFGEK